MLDSPFGRLASALESDWAAQARPEQLPPAGDWFGWLILAGRGWGKTRTGAEWVNDVIESGGARRVALVGATASDVRDIMINGESGILAVSPRWNRPIFEPSYRRLTWPNGAIATAYSAEEAERLRGPQHDAAWADELGSWRNREATWDQLQFGLRLGKRPRIVVTTTPKPIKLIKELLARKDFVVTRGKTSENADNLARSFLETIVGRYAGTRLGRQELDAEILEDVQGALWNRARLDELRVASAPPLRRVVVAIDPATTNGEDSDETGIVAAGLGVDGHGYLLEDASGKYSPTEWASKAVTLYHKYQADRIVAEANQGGQMVETTVRMVDPNVSYKAVHASRGKIVRAEPVSAIYEQNRAHHVGYFESLEDQLCTFSPGSTDSPDRLDALVWAFSELCVGASTTGIIDYYRELNEQANGIENADAEKVQMRPPAGYFGTTIAMSGEIVRVNAGGMASVLKSDAKALRAIGWTEASVDLKE